MLKLFRFPLLFCALVLLAANCGRSDSSPSSDASNTPSLDLRIVTSFKIPNLNPTDTWSFFISEYGCAELPLILDEEAVLKPWLLESWERIDDLRWRLILRPNVAFQNGKSLTAERFAAAMNRQLKLSASTQATLPGAEVRVAGERELILTTRAPDPNVPAALADELVFPIYDVEAVESAAGDFNKLIDAGCYTGPYAVSGLDEREMRLVRHEKYWRGRPPLDRISVRFVSDVGARLLAVQNGEADIAFYPPSEAKRVLAGSRDAFFVTSEQSNGGPRLFFNLRRPPFDETNVRRAFSLGIDYEALARDVMDGVFAPATGFYPPNYSWAVPNQRTDIAEAKRLLEEGGWRMGADGVRTKNGQPLEGVLLVYPQQPDWPTLATALQAQLKEIGFRLIIRQVDAYDRALKEKTSWNAEINSPGVMTTGGAPDPFLSEYLTTDGKQNYGGVADPELDQLIRDLTITFDQKIRADLLARIQHRVVAEMAYEVRPVFTLARAVVGKRYRHYRPSPQLHLVTYETRPAGDGERF